MVRRVTEDGYPLTSVGLSRRGSRVRLPALPLKPLEKPESGGGSLSVGVVCSRRLAEKELYG